MDFENSKELFIQGVTLEGKTFRPSDWAERLAGVMSRFRPGPALVPHPGVASSHHHEARYQTRGAARGTARAMSHGVDFALNFARDNHLQVVEACLLPDEQK